MATPPIRFEPIALKLAREVPLDEFIPLGAVDEMRQARLEESEDAPPLPEHTREFMAHYMLASRCGFMLLDAPELARLARLHELVQEEYMPGAPPMSPVYDSFAIQHVLAEVPVGVAGETPYSVLSRLLSRDAKRRRLYEVAHSLAESHFDLYRVRHADGLTAELEHARSGTTLEVHTTGPFLRTNDRALARVLKFEGRNYISDSPYLLEASIQDWLDYFERVTEELPSPAPKAATAGKSKLSSKQKAKLKAKQRAATPSAAIVRHLRFGPSERFWLDYVMDGYAGERRGIVRLAGVPDRPELLPHSEAYDASAFGDDDRDEGSQQDLPASARLRLALSAIAKAQGLTEQAQAAWTHANDSENEPAPAEQTLFDAYCTLGERNAEGFTALDLFVRYSIDADEDVKALAAALKRGWFSVFRIDRIHLDKGFSVLDVLRRRKLELSEQSATRQVGNGALLAGWISEDEHGVLRLEGGLYYIPQVFSELATALALDLRDEARRRRPGKDWRAQHALLPLQLMAGVRGIKHRLYLTFANTSGDALQFATGRYKVIDRAGVKAALCREYEELGDEMWRWSDADGRVLATLALQDEKLLVRVNSVERLNAAKAHVEKSLGSRVTPLLSSLDGSLDSHVEDAPTPQRDEVPEALLPDIHAMLLQQIKGQFDSPVPMFKGKSLRQLARGKNSRADAISWLREQERILNANPQLAGIDVRPLWRELGLDYQGLDTD